MAKTKGVAYWKNRAWKMFSKYIRLRDAIKTTGTKTHLICCTCDKPHAIHGYGCAQAGHFIPGRMNMVLYSEEQVHGQCVSCNKYKNGNWPNYLLFMRQTHTQDEIDDMIIKSKKTLHMTAQEHKEIYEYYKAKLEELK